jgi:hypothetical protein
MAAQTWITLQNTLLVALSQAVAPYTVIPSDFATLFPQATSYAEQRIYRELVPLNERTQNTSLTTTTASRVLNLTAASQMILTVESFELIYPAGVTNQALGTRMIFDAANLDVIDLVWPQESVTMDPSLADWIGRYWALLDDHTLVFCPTVNGAYTAIITGTFESIPISAANPTTYLSTFYPEVLEAACMVFLTGYLLRNFGAQSDDPRQAVSFESHYKTLMQSAIIEEQRRRMQGAGWSQYVPAPMEKPDRT